MTGNDDYYALLGVDPTADAAEVRHAWRRLAVRWHPDRAGASATFIFQRIQAAYAVLSDPAARADYDRRRSPPRPAPPPPREAPPARRRAPGVMLQRLSGSLGGLLACGTARRAEPGVIELAVNDDEAAQGGMVSISMRVAVYCPACGPDATAPCARCGGTRTVDELFSAWLAVPPGVAAGTMLIPSAMLPGMVRPVSFRVRRGGRAPDAQ